MYIRKGLQCSWRAQKPDIHHRWALKTFCARNPPSFWLVLRCVIACDYMGCIAVWLFQVQPIADRVAQNPEIISKNFFSARSNRHIFDLYSGVFCGGRDAWCILNTSVWYTFARIQPKYEREDVEIYMYILMGIFWYLHICIYIYVCVYV